MPAAPLEALHDDLWAELSKSLRQRDLAALAMCSRALRASARRALECREMLRVRHDRARAMATAYALAAGLAVRGFPRRYGQAAIEAMGLLSLPAMPRLRRLELHHPCLPPDVAFWPTVFEQCPSLRHVRFIGDFFMSNYAADVRHVVDLMTRGVPQLESLDIEGNWLVIKRVEDRTANRRLTELIELINGLAPVRSTTLRRLRHSCRQVPLGVDAPVTDLSIDEQNERPLLLGRRMGPATMATVTKLKWRGYWPGFDAGIMGAMAALRDADIAVLSASDPYRLARCLATLQGLPRGLRRLKLDMDTWPMRTGDSAIAWPSPLGHLDRLERLELTMLFPPDTAVALLGGWLGAGQSVRSAVMRFREPATRSIESEISRLKVDEEADSEDETVLELAEMWARAVQPVSGRQLGAWLDAHPSATATVHNFATLQCSHPRCRLL